MRSVILFLLDLFSVAMIAAWLLGLGYVLRGVFPRETGAPFYLCLIFYVAGLLWLLQAARVMPWYLLS